MEDFLVIGTGMAALGACDGLISKGFVPMVLDIGCQSKLRKESSKEQLVLGQSPSDLLPLTDKFKSISPILNQPAYRFVTERIEAESPDQHTIIQSKAFGGLANAWGAGCFRFNEDDLKDFPFKRSELQPHYDSLSQTINVSWSDDLLTDQLGGESTPANQCAYSRVSTEVLLRFNRISKNYKCVLGRPRLAMNKNFIEDSSKNSSGLHPDDRPFFNPKEQFEKWHQQNKIKLVSGMKVIRVSYVKNHIEVSAFCENSKQTVVFEGKTIFLAAGTLNTAEIIRESLNLTELTCPLLDNPGYVLPFVFTGRIGNGNPGKTPIPTFQLTALFPGKNMQGSCIASLLDFSQVPLSELVRYIPLPLSLLVLLEEVIRARVLASYCFFPCESVDAGLVTFTEKGLKLKTSSNRVSAQDCSEFIKLSKAVGLLPLTFAGKKMPFGASLHYSGTFPFNKDSKDLSTDSLGQLRQLPNVHLVDGSVFPRLPAKNLTFSISANARRIASLVIEKKRST